MDSLFLFVVSLFHLAYQSHEVTGLASLSAIDELDFARSAMMAMAKGITSSKRSRTLIANKHITSISSGKTLGFRRRILKKTTKKMTATRQPRNVNKFNEAMDQIERAMTQAQHASRSFRLTDLQKDIKDGVNRGNVRFARRALGIAFYAASAAAKKSSRRGKRSVTVNAATILADIKKDLGDDKFSDFLALQGEVTLMYAVDITGSMQHEIQAAKAIVTEISKYGRSEPVDFILSSFGDPISQGSVVYQADGQVNAFINEVDKLKAERGGDCAEYAYEGMLNALYDDPRWGSPLYVFTDAPPKDATTENKEVLRALAEELGVTINFFVGIKTCTQAGYKLESFNEEAELYGGQFLRLSSSELSKMAGFTASALGGSTAVVSGTNTAARKKRSTVNQIAIPIDDTVTKLVVTVTTSNSPNGILLTRPGGATWTSGRTMLTKVIVYNIDSPIRGIWKLLIPSSVGKYSYSAKVSSPENIDFEHYYTKVERRRSINVRNPLAGELAYVNLTISGVLKVQVSSLSVSIVDMSGKLLVSNQKLTPVGRSGLRFTVKLQVPKERYKLLLKGRTTSGQFFQRTARNVNEAKELLVKEFYNTRHYTIKQGGSTTILLYLFNGSNKEQLFTIIVKNALGYEVTIPGRLPTKVSAKRKRYLRVRVTYKGGNRGRVGQTLNIVVIVKGKESVTTELVPLMVV